MTTQLTQPRLSATTERTLRRRLLEERSRHVELLALPEFHVDIDMEDRDMALATATRARLAVDDIDAALRRMDDGAYGVCESCGGPIAAQRLHVVPTTTVCIACSRDRRAERRLR